MTGTPGAPASSALRTQRHLRLSLVLLVAALFIAVAIQTVVVSWQPFRLGWQVLPSISHYFYTPARAVFVGVLIAASVAMLALSGRRRPSVFLDVAALFAPLIAIVPTPIRGEGTAPGLTCLGADCIPTALLPEVRVGVATYAIVVVLAVVTTAAIRRRQRIATTSAHRIVSAVALVAAAGLALLAFAPGLSESFPLAPWPAASVHFAAVLLFFGSFAAVPIVYGWRPAEADETPPTPWQRTVYRLVAGLLVADLLFLVLVILDRQTEWGLFGEAPVVLIGEAIALLLFAWFWWEQTLQRWDDVAGPFAWSPAGSEDPAGGDHGTT